MSYVTLNAKEALKLAEKTILMIDKQRQKEWESAIKNKIRRGRFLGLLSCSAEQAKNRLKQDSFISTYDDIFTFSYGRIYSECKDIIGACKEFPNKTLFLNVETVAAMKSWVIG